MIKKNIESLDQINVFHKDGEPLTVFQLLPGTESPEMSLALIALDGVNQKVRNLESNATYMLLAGSVGFILWNGDNHEVVELQQGQHVHIPAGQWYQDVGHGIMVSKNHRAFNPEKVEYEQDRIVLKSQNDTVELRQLILEDAARYFQLVDEGRDHLSQFGDTTAQKYRTIEAVRDSIVHPTNPSKYRFGIWDGEQMVGSVNLTPLEGNRGESGSWVAKGHTGKNYALRARSLLIDFAFNELRMDELVSNISVGNEASRHSVEKSGYILTDTVDDHWIYVLKNPSKL